MKYYEQWQKCIRAIHISAGFPIFELVFLHFWEGFTFINL